MSRPITAAIVASAAVAAALALGTVPVSATTPASRPRIGYVTNNRGNPIDRLDLATGRLLRPLSVHRAAILMAVAPGGKIAYVANPYGSSVAAVDLATGQVKAVIGVGNYVSQIAFSADGKYAYVAITPQAVAVIDTTSQQVVTTLSFPPANGMYWPLLLIVAPHGHMLFALDGPTGTLIEIDTGTNTVRARLVMGFCRPNQDFTPGFTPPFSPDGGVMYAPTSHGVVPVNTTSGKAGALVRAGNNCDGVLLLTAHGRTLFASGVAAGRARVSRIDVTSGGLKLAWTTPSPKSWYPDSMARYGGTLFVGNSMHPLVRAISVASGRLGPLIRAGGRYGARALVKSGRFLFVTDPGQSADDRVAVINPVTRRVVRVIRPGGDILAGLVRWPGRPEVLALIDGRRSGPGWLLPISTRTGRAGQRIVLGGEPNGIVFGG